MRHAEVLMPWADGEYTFRLSIGGLRELRDKTGVGPHELFERILSKKWFVDDLREVIRIGLNGGGTKPTEALRLIGIYFDEQPLLESVPVALAILAPALMSPAGDEPKKAKRQSKHRDRSALPTYTGPVQ